jgi:hypothetical protein
MEKGDKEFVLRFREMAKTHPEKIRVIEAQIDIDLQIEFFERLAELKNEYKILNILALTNLIFDKESTEKECKDALALLSTIDEPSAYRSIEKYLDNPNSKYIDWAMMAYQESRIVLEMSFLEESLVFVASGLGGKNNKMRFSIALVKKGKSNFLDFQKKIILNEIAAFFEQADAELEDYRILNGYIVMSCLIPLSIDVENYIYDLIAEINHYGDFIKSSFIITNQFFITEEDVFKIMD